MANANTAHLSNDGQDRQLTTNTSTQSHYDIPNHFQPQYQLPSNLSEFQEAEGRERREVWLRDMWRQLQSNIGIAIQPAHISDQMLYEEITPEQAQSLKTTYDSELLNLCGVDGNSRRVGLDKFKGYVEAKEAELWQIFHKLDVDGSGHIDARDVSLALNSAGIKHSPSHVSQFIVNLAGSPRSESVTFAEFRNFLLFLPRKPSPEEIYQYYNVRRHKVHGDSAVHHAEAGADLSRKDRVPGFATISQVRSIQRQADPLQDDVEIESDDDDEEIEPHSILSQNSSLKFLLAGGISGAVSRTCTAPFDRLKVFLITRPAHLGGCALPSQPSPVNVAVFKNAVARIYAEGGVLAFWTGNGLSVAKIFPESAIKFFAYESAKRAFAKHWDGVDNPSEISGTSRFLSGGIGGISSQLAIYPVETLKTQMMTSIGQRHSIAEAMRHVWSLGGLRAFYRGLGIGLIGVFPYSAIDMSTFEALKLAYVKSTGNEQPGVLTLLAFGSTSGSIGAISVYPLNLVRTRLQASGSPGHPQRYKGVMDVAIRTWERDGWRGFYRGLLPTLAKVIPSVSITYTVYEFSKRRLGV